MNIFNEIPQRLFELAAEAEAELAPIYSDIDKTAFVNSAKVLDAFREFRVSDRMFVPTTGYGYGDVGRDTLDQIYAKVFGTEAAFVRHNIVNGTHALTIALFGLLRPGDTMLAITGKPYDTLDEAINGSNGDGSLRDFGVNYRQVELGEPFDDAIDNSVKVIYLQRSRGYSTRAAISVNKLNEMIAHARKLAPQAFIVVDNCYGEFTESTEPAADLLIGSLIKNPGGGIAQSGGYIAGSAKAVELASYRFTTPGVGLECGASLGHSMDMYRGFFLAPHVVAQSLKTAAFAAYIFEKLGFKVSPGWKEKRSDIIQTIAFGAPEPLCAFCRGIQHGSPVDSFVTPEPWDMPGYSDQVIMAAGAFTQGSSIELSADGPLRPPYIAYIQGGLTYESGKLGILSAAAELLKSR